MLFKIANLMIIADNKEDAQQIFRETTGRQTMLPVEVLIPEGSNSVQITSHLMSIDTIASLYAGCISSIMDRYQDTNGAVTYMMRYASELSIENYEGIFRALRATQYNETKPMIILFAAMLKNNVKIPDSWKPDIQTHISRFWIRRNYNTETWYLDSDILKMSESEPEPEPVLIIHQLSETDETIEELYNTSMISVLRRLLNSTNYSYETLFEFVEEHQEHQWVLDHYKFKQTLIRDGTVKCINADSVHADQNSTRTVL